MTLNYALLSKAISKMGKKQQEKPVPQVDAADFLDTMSEKYNTVDKYFISNPTSLLDAGENMLNSADLAALDYPLTLEEMLEKM